MDKLYNYEDTSIIRNELQKIYQNSVKKYFNKLEIDHDLIWWTVPHKMPYDDNFYQCFLLLKLSEVTQNNIFILQANFFNNFKNRIGNSIIKGAKIDNIQSGFCLRDDIIRKKSANKLKKNKSAILCIEKERCYLITANSYYRMPLSSINNSPINHKLTNYHVTLSASNNY